MLYLVWPFLAKAILCGLVPMGTPLVDFLLTSGLGLEIVLSLVYEMMPLFLVLLIFVTSSKINKILLPLKKSIFQFNR